MNLLNRCRKHMGRYERAIIDLMETIPFLDKLTSWKMEGLDSMNSGVVRFPPSQIIIQEGAVESEINPTDNKPSSLIFESLLKTAGIEK